MKYQGTTDVCLEITPNIGMRVSFNLESKHGQHWFSPHTQQFYTSTNDNEVLSNYNHDMQRQIIIKSNEMIDMYLAEFDNELLVALATDKLLEQIQNNERPVGGF